MANIVRPSRKARLLRKQRELTLKEVAAAVGLKEPTLGNFETGKSDLSFEALERLANYFKTTPADLLEPIRDEFRDNAPDYRAPIDPKTIRWLVRNHDDATVIKEISAALVDTNMPWPNRITTARTLLEVLDGRHQAGE